MSRLVFLLEEFSMKVFLEAFLPRLYPDLDFLCIPHEGKQDLEKSIPRKLRSWREPGVHFLVVRDNDGAACSDLKLRLRRLCDQAHRPDTVVRIACQDLEAWYLGDPEALADAFDAPRVRDLALKERFRDPDAVVNPSQALMELVPEFQKVSGARRIAAFLERDRNISRSFQVFLAGVEEAMGQEDAPGPGAAESR